MPQWVNHLQNNIFVNPLPFPLSCEISGALHLVQLDLTAGWGADRQMKYRLISNISKLVVGRNIQVFIITP